MVETSVLKNSLRRTVLAKPPGTVFSPSDFLEFGSRAVVDQTLSRLTKEGSIRRIRRGVYDIPHFNTLLGINHTPAPDAVAQAITRGKKAVLQVSGAQAANLLGLTTQVPARIIYLTDGASGRVQIGHQIIETRHAAPRNMHTAGRVSGTVIQALRHLGRKQVTPETVARLQRQLSQEHKQTLRGDIIHAPEWMRPILQKISEEGNSGG